MNAFPIQNKRYNRKNHGRATSFILTAIIAALCIYNLHSCAHQQAQPVFQDYRDLPPHHFHPGPQVWVNGQNKQPND